MTYPRAHRGVKFILIGEILIVLNAILSFVEIALLILALYGNFAALASAAVFSIVTIGLPIIGFILNIIGLYFAHLDEPYFKNALYILLFAILLSVVGVLISLFTTDQLAPKIIDIVVNGCTVFAMVYTIIGVSVLAQDLGENKFANRSGFLVNFLVGIFIFFTILDAIGFFIKDPSETTTEVLTYLRLSASVIEIIANLMFITYLARSIKTLSLDEKSTY